MNQTDCSTVILRRPELAGLLKPEAWKDIGALSEILGGGAMAGHLLGEGFALHSVLRPGACVRRALVHLAGTPPLLVAFDAMVSPAPKRWVLEGLERPQVRGSSWSAAGISGRTFLPGAAHLSLSAGDDKVEAVSRKPGSEAFFLTVLQPGGEVRAVEISSVDLAGVRAGEWLVLFHTDVASARTPVFFDLEGAGEFKYLLSGLAAGQWDVWRDGFLERIQEPLMPGDGALFLKGPAGSYFIRRNG